MKKTTPFLSSILVFIMIVLTASCKKENKDDNNNNNITPQPFVCGQMFTDTRDNKQYKTVKIGNQCWMAENLNYSGHTTGESWCYNQNSSHCVTYGRLYNWAAANASCPEGWRLSSDLDWITLEMFLGMTNQQAYNSGNRGIQGELLKTLSWNGKDSVGFSALPGGFREITPEFKLLGGILTHIRPIMPCTGECMQTSNQSIVVQCMLMWGFL
jgi:uncharacterized protein (TIGR02145 family)